jgi:hypothetical protein
MKMVLVICYSQTGQLARCAQSVIGPLLKDPDIQVTILNIEPRDPYPFPWPVSKFLNVFPESVLMIPPPLNPLALGDPASFDLVILAYTVWYLSPSLPTTGFLKSAEARSLFLDKPVITLIGCRGMWLMAQEKVKKMLWDLGATLTDNIVLTDRGALLASLITTPRWMLTGKKNRFLGVFPPAGISENSISGASRFGSAIAESLRRDEFKQKKPVLKGLGAARVNLRLITTERIAQGMFAFWAKIIRRAGARSNVLRNMLLACFLIFLLFAVGIILPFGRLVSFLVYPLIRSRLAREKASFESGIPS